MADNAPTSIEVKQAIDTISRYREACNWIKDHYTGLAQLSITVKMDVEAKGRDAPGYDLAMQIIETAISNTVLHKWLLLGMTDAEEATRIVLVERYTRGTAGRWVDAWPDGVKPEDADRSQVSLTDKANEPI